jgi:hypothetical protein
VAQDSCQAIVFRRAGAFAVAPGRRAYSAITAPIEAFNAHRVARPGIVNVGMARHRRPSRGIAGLIPGIGRPTGSARRAGGAPNFSFSFFFS